MRTAMCDGASAGKGPAATLVLLALVVLGALAAAAQERHLGHDAWEHGLNRNPEVVSYLYLPLVLKSYILLWSTRV